MMIKKFVVAALLGLLVDSASGQLVFTYGNKQVDKVDFLRAFNKNPGTAGDRKKALKEYLDLYINFKLKVQAAYDAKLQDDATQQYELENFKKQIAENIINDEAKVKDLANEAFQRSQKDIHLAQVFVEVAPKADTVEAFKKIQAAYKALKEGKDFVKVSEEFSSDAATRQSGGDLGFVTVFTLPYEFENVAYRLKAMDYSAPFKSKLGYHIFKNTGERKGLGRRKVAQILITYPPGATDTEKTAAKRKADSVYTLLQNGAGFEELVRTVSNDVSTVNNNGQLSEFGVGEYSTFFEDAAFALTKPNDISRPFQTNYGYHILKLLDAKPVSADINDPESSSVLRDKILQDQRLTTARKMLVDKRQSLIKYKPAIYNQAELWRYTDSILEGKKVSAIKAINDKTLLFSFAKQNIRVADWEKFVKAIRANPNTELGSKNYKDLMKEYVSITGAEYYRNHLEDYSGEYKQQVQEFKEANLLFGIMDKNVWSKASVDSAGLQAYYNEHKNKYQWAPSAEALIITVATETLAKELQQKLKQNTAGWKTLTENYGSQVVADSGRYELSQLPAVEKTIFTEGLATAPLKNAADGTFTFNYIIKVYSQPAPRSFEDSRGMIISDYQQVLEERWIAALKKKYPVKVNQAVFNALK